MNFAYSKHARDNMAKRSLDAAWIEMAVSAPDWTEPDPDDSRVTRAFRAVPFPSSRILRVAYRRRSADILIITAFFDRGARP